LQAFVVNAVSCVRAAARGFMADDGQVYAAGIAFYALVSLVPLCAVLVSVGGFVLALADEQNGTEQLVTEVIQGVRRLIPFLDEKEAREIVRSLVVRRGDIGLFGVLGGMAAASQVIHAFIRGVAKPFGTLRITGPAHPGAVTGWLGRVVRFIRRWSKAYLGIGLLGCFLALVRFVLTAVSRVSHLAPPAVTAFFDQRLVAFGVSTGGGFLLSLFGYVLLVWFLGRSATSWMGRLAGGVAFALMQALAEVVYAYYVHKASNMTLTYGSLAGLVAVALWVYYSACVFLFCAELTAVVSHPARRDPVTDQNR
jgi:membrane protein